MSITKQQVFTFENLEQLNIWNFYFKKDFKLVFGQSTNRCSSNLNATKIYSVYFRKIVHIGPSSYIINPRVDRRDSFCLSLLSLHEQFSPASITCLR